MTRKPAVISRHAGLLIPSSNLMLETDFHLQSPYAWSFHSARMYLEDISVFALARMIDEFAMTAARDLASIQPDVVVFGSTSATALRGNEYEDQLIRKIEDVVHAPVISAMKAARQALKSLHVSRIAVLTPYVNELNQQIRASLEHDELKVIRIEGFNLTRCSDMARMPVDQLINLARLMVEGSQPDALFICSTNLPVMTHLKEIQDVVPCPVVANNQAIIEEVIKIGNKPI